VNNGSSNFLNDPSIMPFVDDGNVLLMDDLLFRFMNNWNMLLMHMFLLNYWLNVLVDDVLVVLMKYISVLLFNDVPMMFVDNSLMHFSHESSFLMLSYNCLLLVS